MGIIINVIHKTIKVCLLDLAYQSIDKVGLDTKILLTKPPTERINFFSPPKNANVSFINEPEKRSKWKFKINENFKNKLDYTDREKALKGLVDQNEVITKYFTRI